MIYWYTDILKNFWDVSIYLACHFPISLNPPSLLSYLYGKCTTSDLRPLNTNTTGCWWLVSAAASWVRDRWISLYGVTPYLFCLITGCNVGIINWILSRYLRQISSWERVIEWPRVEGMWSQQWLLQHNFIVRRDIALGTSLSKAEEVRRQASSIKSYTRNRCLFSF